MLERFTFTNILIFAVLTFTATDLVSISYFKAPWGYFGGISYARNMINAVSTAVESAPDIGKGIESVFADGEYSRLQLWIKSQPALGSLPTEKYYSALQAMDRSFIVWTWILGFFFVLALLGILNTIISSIGVTEEVPPIVEWMKSTRKSK